jgi:hypothetical protein
MTVGLGIGHRRRAMPLAWRDRRKPTEVRQQVGQDRAGFDCLNA